MSTSFKKSIMILTKKYNDTGDELNEAKKKINDYKEIENQEKVVDKKKFIKYFNFKPTALVNKLLSQNTTKKWIKQNERNSTNDKNENDTLNMIFSIIDRIDQFLEWTTRWIKITKMGKSK